MLRAVGPSLLLTSEIARYYSRLLSAHEVPHRWHSAAHKSQQLRVRLSPLHLQVEEAQRLGQFLEPLAGRAQAVAVGRLQRVNALKRGGELLKDDFDRPERRPHLSEPAHQDFAEGLLQVLQGLIVVFVLAPLPRG